jgi:uncharacterized membrane protein HdeD (DUF308 family)
MEKRIFNINYMETKTFKSWWFMILNGLVAIALGLMLLLLTKETIEKLVMFFGLFIALCGIVIFLSGIYKIKNQANAGWILLQSVITLAIGIIIMINPGNSLNFFLVFIGIWAVAAGIFQLALLVVIKTNFPGKRVLLANGFLTVVLGVLLFFHPFEVANFVAKVIGLFSILFGIIMIWFSISVRKLPSRDKTGS